MTDRQPNILFLFPDQHRPDWLGCNGDLPLRTPNLDRLAGNGARFINAFTPSPLCAPARACLATGRDYRRCGVVNNGQNTPVSLPNYYRGLRDAGYEVCGVGKFDIHKADHDQGLEGQNLIREYGFTSGIDNEGKWDAILKYRGNGLGSFTR
ncbi:MAG: sulfatase-like hydrolase/transferase [Kiritimatiellia bacterium]